MDNETKTVLLIDDEERLLVGLTAYMKRAGYHVLATTDSTEGLRLTREHQPDMIVCDVMMPYPNGFELRDLLAQDERTAAIPFIFLTARTDQSDKLHGIDAGADDYVTKPFDRQELLARMQAVFRRAELGRRQGITDADLQMERLRREITQNFSHELRTPITEVLMSLDIALSQRYFHDDQGKIRFIEMALRGARRLHNLVEDLIFLASIDQGRPDTWCLPINLQFHFDTPVRQCLNNWQDKQLDVHIKTAPNVVVYAPRAKFQHVVGHLVDNACKFSPDGGHIDVHMDANGEGGCILQVIDQGPGIPPELREQVFERYYQASQGDARVCEGLGVGLTIARAFARSLGGDVTILHARRGCRVQMTLPPRKLER